MQIKIYAASTTNLKTNIAEKGIMVSDGYVPHFIPHDNVEFLLDHKLIEIVVSHNTTHELVKEIYDEELGILINETWYDYDDVSYIFDAVFNN